MELEVIFHDALLVLPVLIAIHIRIWLRPLFHVILRTWKQVIVDCLSIHLLIAKRGFLIFFFLILMSIHVPMMRTW